MKKNYFILVLAILFFTTVVAQEAQKNFINYQGVARNVDNELMASEAMTINIGVKFGAANAAKQYEESHSIMTNANGVFSLLIGNGSPVEGNYNSLPWGSAATFVSVSLNGNEIGTTELMAVPYAISAGNTKDTSAAEVPYDNSVSGLGATNTQDAIDELVTGGGADADSDPTNEFQTLSFDAITNELSLSDGNVVTIPSGGTDADADPTNEIQSISFNTFTNELSLSDGGTVIIPSGGTDADADPENEFQTLNFNATTNELSLSDGNSVTIPSGGTDADADPENELQNLSLSGTTLNISEGMGVDLTPLIPPGSSDNQNLTFNEATKILEIEDGNTVDLSSLSGGGTGSSPWSATGVDAIYYSDGNVGIGIMNPSNEHHVHSPSGGTTLYTLDGYGDSATDGLSVGVTNGLGAAIGFVRLNEDGPLNLGTNSQTRVSIREDGLVGVGTQSPTAELDVDGTIRTRDLIGGGNVVADADGKLVIGSTGGGSSSWSEDANGINYSLGNIGIGASSSSYPLNITTDSERPINLTSSDNDNYIAFNNSGGYKGYAGIFNGDNDMDFGTGLGNSSGKVHLTTNASPKLTVATNGDVGIGTTTPNAKLEVDGDIKTSGEIHGPSTGNANMVAIAYGRVAANGTIEEGSGNFTINKLGSNYFVRVEGTTLADATQFVSVATRLGSLSPGFISSGYGISGGVGSLIVNTFDKNGDGVDASFSFVIYKD